ncbi:transposase DNA-binding-containing protein [Geminocystis sp. CENA526]|uniref:IS4/Tn5 family transposase DNA-binding protein n=1 Tax=Geminocystis sp. CENA526 TaxID=1355871 RepID=UPI003D6FFC29
MHSWAEEELKDTGLPDKRLNQRLIKIVTQAVEQPSATIPQASETWSDTKATYDFWKFQRFDYGDIIEGHHQKTLQRAGKEELVLMIQDTSDFNFTHHRSKTWEKGFGQTSSQNYVRGLKVHSSLMVSTQGVPLFNKSYSIYFLLIYHYCRRATKLRYINILINKFYSFI